MIKQLSMFASMVLNREFRLVPYGQSFESDNGRLTISCDGRIPGGVDLEVTHWTGNLTPDRLYKDTSTEMALELFRQKQDFAEYDDALVLNNHYDTDGVLSVFACLEPQLALQHSDLLAEGAAAGDFGEWSSDRGVELDSVIEGLNDGDEEKAYKDVLKELPKILTDLTDNNGIAYQHLWEKDLEETRQGWQELTSNRASLRRGPGRMAILQESQQVKRLSSYALDRGLKDQGLWQGTTRILRVREETERTFLQYQKVGHGWVKKVVERHIVPDVDSKSLVADLQSQPLTDAKWTSGGPGLVAICQGSVPKGTKIDDVAELLHKLDAGCQ